MATIPRASTDLHVIRAEVGRTPRYRTDRGWIADPRGALVGTYPDLVLALAPLVGRARSLGAPDDDAALALVARIVPLASEL